jgi:protein-disulfide isomerase
VQLTATGVEPVGNGAGHVAHRSGRVTRHRGTTQPDPRAQRPARAVGGPYPRSRSPAPDASDGPSVSTSTTEHATVSTPPDAPARRAQTRGLLVPGAALLAVLLLALAAFAGGGDPDPTAEAGAAATSPDGALDLQALERREPGDPLALGAVDAPVVMIEWADFQCRFCALFSRDTEPALVERYVADGTLRIEWRDLPILGEESWTSALGGRAAAEQGAFWEFHAAVFAEDRGVDRGQLTLDAVVAIAEDLGLDVERFRSDLEDPALLEAIQRDREEGQRLGATSTPAFLVNGQPILGAQPLEVFEAAIEQAAADAGA